ncbi:hypothetical protein EGW08_018678, partial [Elysia chlorotica]
VHIKSLMFPDGFVRVSVHFRAHDTIECLVGIPLHSTSLLLSNYISCAHTKHTSIQRSFVKHQSILNIVTTVAHHSNGGILTCWQLVKVNQFNGLHQERKEKKSIIQGVQQRVNAVPLVVSYGAHGLLAHSALIRVTRRLVVVGVRNQTCANTEDGEGLYLQVCSIS